ncbi:MAG: hypothetical protein HY692_08810, partial [Cyanobacteria bacterium NC_groundwater_1444_Ag_S-0.65um_54_12]|nr:hypothetical protein [Cyanobacteria bacterium NC_groundwater_1444_Ag_S-0.65um_54_12]
IEVWNSWFWNPLSVDDPETSLTASASPELAIYPNEKAISWWVSLVAGGARVAAIAATDFHRKPQNIARPCTLVLASDRSEKAILAGIRAGRTIMTTHPRGPRVELQADADHDGVFEATIGDTVPVSSALRIRVKNARGAILRLKNGSAELLRSTVTSADWVKEIGQRELAVASPSFVFARVDSIVVHNLYAMTGALYLR